MVQSWFKTSSCCDYSRADPASNCCPSCAQSLLLGCANPALCEFECLKANPACSAPWGFCNPRSSPNLVWSSARAVVKVAQARSATEGTLQLSAIRDHYQAIPNPWPISSHQASSIPSEVTECRHLHQKRLSADQLLQAFPLEANLPPLALFNDPFVLP